MKRKSRLIILAAVALLCLGAPVGVQSQVIGQPYRLSDKEVEKIIRQVDRRAETFRESLDASLDRSRLDGTKREDDINAFIKDFDEHTKRLHDRFDAHKSVASDVEAVLNRASFIEKFVRRHRLSDRAQKDWAALQASLDDLAHAYSVSWRWDGYGLIGNTPDLAYRLTDKEIEQLLHRIEQQATKFRTSIDTALDRSRLDGTKREDDINAFIKEFDQEVKRLHDRFDERKSVAADVQAVLDRSDRINDFMRRHRLTDSAQGEWLTLKTNLDELAQAYGVSWRWRY